MSLKYVVIDCQHCNTATEGLQVLNFKPSYVCLHPQSVYSFYKTCNIGNVHDDKSCRRESSPIDKHDKDDDDDLPDSEQSDADPDPEEVVYTQEDSDSDFSEVE